MMLPHQTCTIHLAIGVTGIIVPQNLGAVLLAAGFSLDDLYRTYNDQIVRCLLFRLYAASFLHRYLDIDFAAISDKSERCVAESRSSGHA